MKKRFSALTLFLSLLLCLNARAAEPQLELHPPDTPVQTGEEFDVTVDLTGNPGIKNIKFALTFDRTRMECTKVKIGSLLAEQGAAAVNPNAPSGAMLAVASPYVITEDGSVGIFRFKAKGKISDFHFTLTELEISGENGRVEAAVSIDRPNAAPSTPDTPQPDTGTPSVPNTPPPSQPDTPTPSVPNTPSPSVPNPPPPSQPDTPTPSAPNTPTPSTPDNTQTDTVQPSPPRFTDTAGTWAESYINTASERNLFQGYADGTFRPNNLLSRAQFMMVLWNLAGRPDAPQETPFVDMLPQIENFRKAVAWAYSKGYVNGTSADTFSPGEPLTRQAAMKILFSYHGGARGAEAMLTDVYDSLYSDSGRISSWAKNAMYWGVYQKIISGTSETTLDPGGAVTRAQLAAIMVRYTDRFHV